MEPTMVPPAGSRPTTSDVAPAGEDWADADARRREADDRRWVLIRSAGLGLVLAGTIAIGWHHLHQERGARTFCTADGYLTDDGVHLHRDPDQGCAWVDEQGARVDPQP